MAGNRLKDIFLAFQSTIFLTSFLYARISKTRDSSSGLMFSLVVLGCLFSLLLTISMDRLVWSLVFFCICEAFLTILMAIFKARLNERIESEIRASVLSTISFIGKLGSISGLMVMSWWMNNAKDQIVGLRQIFIGSAIIGSLLYFLALRISNHNVEENTCLKLELAKN